METIISVIGLENIDMFTRVLAAMLLGMALGVERVFARKAAGMRTYTLVSMGAALYTVISFEVARQFAGITVFDPLRVASQIVVGLGFLGAGVIVFQGKRISGLTTAAGIWISGAIGVASGFALYSLAVFVTILSLFTFSVLWYVEQKIKKISGVWHEESDI